MMQSQASDHMAPAPAAAAATTTTDARATKSTSVAVFKEQLMQQQKKKHAMPKRDGPEMIGGISARFLPLGAIIQSFSVHDTTSNCEKDQDQVEDQKEGSRVVEHESFINIVQGFDTAADYRGLNTPYFGETIGRVANRVSGARIDSLNGGRTYSLDANNGENCLHGGFTGWGKQAWRRVSQEEHLQNVCEPDDGRVIVGRLIFTRTSEDGEGGFPGEVEVYVTYSERVEKTALGASVSVLEIEYEAVLVRGADETAIAMTNHSYFNLNGANTESTIAGTQVTLSTNHYLPVNKSNIPIGTIAHFPSIHPHQSFTLGPVQPDIDHCFILNTDPARIPTDTRTQSLNKLASFYHSTSQIHLEVHSTEPAFQFYTGKYIDVPATGDIPARGPRTGFCVEPCRYINAVNVDAWKDMVVLRRGQKYGSRIVYRAWKDVIEP